MTQAIDLAQCPGLVGQHRASPQANVAAHEGLIDRTRCYGCGAWLRFDTGTTRAGWPYAYWVLTQATR